MTVEIGSDAGTDGELGKPGDAPAQGSVECRPSTDYLILAGMLGVVALLLMTPIVPGGFQLGELLLVTAICAGLWSFRVVIVADEHGLNYRRGFGWRFVPWHEVRDFYELPGKASSLPKHASTNIEVPGRTLSFVFNLWTHIDDLRAIVARNAKNARTREWALKGTRDGDIEPIVFGYRVLELYARYGWLAAYGLSWGIRIVPKLHPGQTYATIGWQWALAEATAALFLPAVSAVMLCLSYPSFRKARARLPERIETNSLRISYEGGARHISTSWDEVIHYGYKDAGAFFDGGSNCRVATCNGEIEFHETIHDAEYLKTIIERLAPAGSGDWSHPTDEILGDSALRVKDCPDRGSRRRFDYWNRSNRALLWFPVFIGFLFVCVSLLSPLISDAGMNPLPAGLGLAVLSVTYYVRSRLKSMRICIYLTDDGIGQTGFFRSKFIPWTKVEAFTAPAPGNTTYSVVGKSGTIRFGSGVNYFGELKAELERRAPKR